MKRLKRKIEEAERDSILFQSTIFTINNLYNQQSLQSTIFTINNTINNLQLTIFTINNLFN